MSQHPHSLALALAALFLFIGAGSSPGQADDADITWFENRVRPLLAEKCHGCHGPETSKAGLRLDHRTSILEGGARGPAIVPGDPDRSLLVHAVGYTDVDLQMPPRGQLSESDRATLREWIVKGAPWPDEPKPTNKPVEGNGFDLERRKAEHWAWRPLRQPAIPDVLSREWVRDPLDTFILHGLEQAGLRPASEASPGALCRRLFLALTGLPPTEADLTAFEQDHGPEAYRALVDRLLDSPHFGERWGRHWLDLVRYAESYGHEYDYPIPHASHYRDYVIRALNADVPYDQLVREHIAGDLMDPPRRHPEEGFNESIIATGFWHLHQATHAPVDSRLDEAERMDNQVDVFSKTFLGLTVACARCHDHKFDAISTADYYALCGYLQSSRRVEAFLDPLGRITAGTETLKTLVEEGSTSLLRGLPDRTPEEWARLLLAAGEVAKKVVPGASRWESEDLKTAGKPKGAYRPQPVAGLSGGHHMWWTGAKPGDRLVLRLPDVGAGPRRLVLGLTRARDYARIQVLLDRVPIGDPIDLYDPNVVPTGPIDLGVVDLKAGPHRLAFQITGAHPDALKAYMVGIDWIEFGAPPDILAETLERVARIHRLPAADIERTAVALRAAHEEGVSAVSGFVSASRETRSNDNGTVAAPIPDVNELPPPAFERFDGPAFGGWFPSGEAFGDGPITASTWDPMTGGLHAKGSVHSGRFSRAHQGALRSPSFIIEKPHIHYRLAGEGGQIRLIVDGYTLDTYNALIFQGISFDVKTGGRWTWYDQAGDITRVLGRRAWIEILDHGDGWVAVDEIRFSDAPVAPEESPSTPVAGTSQRALARSLGTRLSEACEAVREGRGDHAQAALVAWLLRHGLAPPPDERILSAWRQAAAAIPPAVRVLAMQDGTPRDESVFIRGSHKTLGPVVPRRFLDALGGARPKGAASGSGRNDLADAMLSPDNPQPARVQVNRIWHHLFGRGIVPTPDNFGVLGQAPVHGDLLDHLAITYRLEGWSTKGMIRRIVCSSAWRMASEITDPEAEGRDPLNELLHRRLLVRLEGEIIRDSLLALGGNLDPTLYGPSIPIHLTPFLQGRGRPGKSGPEDGAGRRSIYIRVLRNFLDPMMQAFDGPIPHTTVGRRTVSNVPAQALVLLNSPFVQAQARAWAARVVGIPDLDAAGRVRMLYRMAFARDPRAEELDLALRFVQGDGRATGEGESADDSVTRWADFAHVLCNAKEFLFIP